MRYTTGEDFRRALEMRLRTLALRDGASLMRLRKLVAFERFLARLLIAQPDAWVLKGGLALQLRLGSRARTTKDMDIMWRRHSASPLHQLLVAAASLDLGDWFRFTVEKPILEQHLPDEVSKRFNVGALLDSRPFELFHIDVGVDDPMVEPAQPLLMHELLDFASIAPTVAPCFPITQQLAEKIHAYTRPRAAGATSRVKDLIDILLLAGLQPMRSETLHQALAATFASQATHPLPVTLPDPPGHWVQPLRRMADETGLTWRELSDAAGAAKQFVNPILAGDLVSKWNPVAWTWEG